jgi:hypothetical protein
MHERGVKVAAHKQSACSDNVGRNERRTSDTVVDSDSEGHSDVSN